ncbi:MAG: MBL fold metallo-hydrolase, partial [Actinomycetes bacterium]
AVYTGDAYHREWMTGTLDRVAAFGAEVLVGGRGTVAKGRAEADRAVALTRDFLTGLVGAVETVQRRGGGLEEAYALARETLAPTYGGMAVFDHALVFDVQRAWDEVAGEQPRMWTVDRDHSVWDRLRG